MLFKTLLFFIAISSFFLSLFVANSRANPFPIDDFLRKRVDFWIKVYTEFSSSEGVIHDALYPEIILEKMDFRIEEADLAMSAREREKKIQRRIKDVKEFYRRLFIDLHHKIKKNDSDFSVAEQRIVDLYKEVQEPNKFYLASHPKRIRLQRGLKDRFLQGLYYSGRYLPTMEKIFSDAGVPVEITRLPFVESSFNVKARSKVGASGIWQFMRSTGKLYLKINDTVDERNDPIRATEGAAQLLKQNYEALGSWPLAITAYNHGRKGMMRGVRMVGSDKLSDLIGSYRSRNFGFASSNFFTEFMAALEVEKNAEKYFGTVEREPQVPFSEFIMNDYVSVHDICTYTRIHIETLIDLNHGLSESVIHGRQLIPAGYVLRIPLDLRDSFLTRYNEIPASKKFTRQRSLALQALGH